MAKHRRHQANENEPSIQREPIHDEEFAAEVAPVRPFTERFQDDRRTDDREETADRGRGLGITSIILSVLAFFILPFVMAPAGIVVGVIAARRGSALGWWGVAVGIVALIISTLVLPFRIIF
jgi:hypothetical protein